jgi:hypothetical protein
MQQHGNAIVDRPRAVNRIVDVKHATPIAAIAEALKILAKRLAPGVV